MKVYLVKLHYDDGHTYESMAYDYVFTAFDNKEKAIDFCKKNSDEYDEEYDEYKILTVRTIVDPGTNNDERIEPCTYEFDEEIGDFYWFTIEELNVL